ncbi:MAG: aldehyde dehydrogenase family protein [Proteobacteria bacterium]|nr:aldehyde dehydrogenase family protein [Pseudomonadota bacterium]HQR04594.1 aldehyde dehydrogenase family protein [Rhodocyclaceae bacterium]
MQNITTGFARLKASTPRLAQTSARERADKLRALLNATLAAKQRFFEASYEELKSCDLDVAGQLMMIKTEVDFAAKHLEKWMKPRKVPNSAATFGKKCYIRYEPKGVMLNLSTWNAPVCISLIPPIAAIAAGNAVALKPSELAPLSGGVVREVVESVFSADEFAVFEGGPDVAQALLEQPWNHIYYTGGQRVGRIVMKAAAEYFSGVTLEMGGKNPVFIDASADIPNAARKIAWGRLANSGQVCVAPDYALVHASRHEAFITALKDNISAMYNPKGEGFDKSSEYLRIVNEAQASRIKRLIDDAVAKGAQVAFGGEVRVSERFVAPTILTGVTEEMEILHEEVFGPVLAVLPYQHRDDAIEMVRRRPKPLALYIYATEREAMDYFLTNTSAGSTVINHNLIQSGTNPNLPFGGANHSGIGRIGGERGFQEMSNARSVVEQPLGWRDFAFNFPPYSKNYRKMIEKALG